MDGGGLVCGSKGRVGEGLVVRARFLEAWFEIKGEL